MGRDLRKKVFAMNFGNKKNTNLEKLESGNLEKQIVFIRKKAKLAIRKELKTIKKTGIYRESRMNNRCQTVTFK